MSTRAKVILISAISLVLVATIAVVATFLIIKKQQDDAMKEADAAAAAYAADVAEFRELAGDELTETGSDSPTQTLEAARDLEDELPTLGDAPDYGRENSADYAAAEKTRTQLKKDLVTLINTLERTVDVAAFVSAGRTALDLQAPPDLLGPGPFANGQPVRDTAIPGIQALKDDFLAVEAPKGLEDAESAVTAALDHVLTELDAMAASLDNGVSYSFLFGEQYNDALDLLQDAEDDARAPLDEAIDALVEGDRSV